MEENYCILQIKSLILFDELNLKCYLGCQFIFISSISSENLYPTTNTFGQVLHNFK